MRVAVIGNGLLGTTLGLRHGYTVLTHDDIEVRDPASVRRALDGFDIAINTAAYHRLLDCERNPDTARDINEIGARNVASVVTTIYISTDYVFNCCGPHDEAIPGDRPRSVYGRTKLAGELATLERGGTVVRVSALYGHHPSHKGPTFPEMIVSSFDSIALPHDQRFAPTYAPDAADRIAEVIGQEGIFHAANAGSTTWAEFGEQICEVLPWRRLILPVAAKDKLRPGNSVIRSVNPMRHWRLALGEWADVRRQELLVAPVRSSAR